MRTLASATLLACLLLGCEGQAKLPATCLDTQNDPQNCGTCGHECSAGAHATAVCVAGQCGTVCHAGWRDLEANAAGCESSVAGVPETGTVVLTPSSGTSLLQHAEQTGAHRNEAIVGQPTPLPAGPVAEQTSSEHRNLTGFAAFQQ